MTVPAAFCIRTLPAEGGDPALEVIATGETPDFLLVHGACCQARVWVPLMQALAAQGRTAAALSLRGHGGSGGRKLLQAYRIMDYVRDVRRVLAGWDRAPVLVGHSMGGLVAHLVAEEEEVAVPGLALLASSPVGGMHRDGLRMLLRQPRTFLRAMRERSLRSLYRDEAVTRWLLFSRAAPPELVHRFQEEAVEESWLAGSEMNTWLPAPQRIRCPVLVAGGAEDNMVCAASVQRTAAAHGVAPVFLPGRGHMVQAEGDPGELAALLLRFRAEACADPAGACATAS